MEQYANHLHCFIVAAKPSHVTSTSEPQAESETEYNTTGYMYCIFECSQRERRPQWSMDLRRYARTGVDPS